MRYLLTESEALLIKQKFNFGTLLGLNQKQRIKFGTEKVLKRKGIIYSNNGKDELSTEYRALFSCWEKMRFSVVRPELNDKDHLQCLLSNEQTSVFFVRKKDDLTIDVFDFRSDVFDNAICAFAEIEDVPASDPAFVLSMSLDDYEEFIVSDKEEDFIKWKKVTGLDSPRLEGYVKNINTKGVAQMLLVEDHVGDCGYMAKIVNGNDGIYAVKHVTYNDKEKMVLIYGSKQHIVNSIYNF